MSAFLALLRRDLALSLSAGGTGLMGVAFFVAVTLLAPLAIGPEPNLLARIAPGLVWIGIVLSALLSLERLFQSDYEDGSLDLFTLSRMGLIFVVLAKVLAQWLAAGLPLVIAAPILSLMLGLEPEGYSALVLGLLIGTPSLYLIGALGAALTLGVRRGGLLIALIVLPLQIPFVVFGVGAVEAALTGNNAWPALMIEGALSLLVLALAPVAAAPGIRLHLS